MSKLADIFKKENISDETLRDIVATLKANPLESFAKIGELNLSDESIEQLLTLVMGDPQAIDRLALELGFSDEDVETIKKKMQLPPPD